MAVTFECPECQKVLKSSAPPGKKIRCPRCEAVFPVPADDEDDRPSSAIQAKKNGAPPRRKPPAEDEDDQPVKNKSKASGASIRSAPRKGPVADDDEDFDRDDEDDDEEEDRPRTKKKKKKKKTGSGLIIGLIAGGVGLLLILGFVVTAFLWPGFLLRERLPAGTGQENLMAFVPAKVDYMAGLNLAFVESMPDGRRELEQNMQKITELAAQKGGEPPPPGFLDLLRDAEKLFVAGHTVAKNGVLAVITQKPYDPVKMRKTLKANVAKNIYGKRCYVVDPQTLLYMPNDRVVIVCKLPENELEPILNSDGVAARAGNLATAAQKLANNSIWATFSLEGKAKELEMLGAVGGPKQDKDVSDLVKSVSRARAASFWMDINKGMKVGVGLECSSDADAGKLKGAIDKQWAKYKTMVSGLTAMLALKPELKDLQAAATESIKSLAIGNQGSQVSITVQLSEKTMQDLQKAAKAMLPAGGGPGGMRPGMPGMPGMKGMPGMPMPRMPAPPGGGKFGPGAAAHRGFPPGQTPPGK